MIVRTKAGLEPVVCISEVACLRHYRLDPVVHREAVGEQIRIFKHWPMSLYADQTTYMLIRLVIWTLYWALMPATLVGKNMVAQANVTKSPLGMNSWRL